MTPEKQRIAIAEACGWIRDGYNGFQNTWKSPVGERFVESFLPDYLNDLNAMHEAEKVLSPLDNDRMTGWLLMLLGEENQAAIKSFTAVRKATATQRAEAFLRTLNLWTD